MNRRRKNLDKLLAIARDRREWIKDFVDLEALPPDQLKKIDERIEEIKAARKFDELQNAPRRGAGAPLERLPYSLDHARTQPPVLGVSSTIRYPPNRQMVLNSIPKESRYNAIIDMSNTREFSLVSREGEKEMSLEDSSATNNPYKVAPTVEFNHDDSYCPVGLSGDIVGVDCTDDDSRYPQTQGRMDYELNLEDRIDMFKEAGLYPADAVLNWDDLNKYNNEQGFEDFYGGIDGGTTITYLGDWFVDETSDVIPEFLEEIPVSEDDPIRYREDPETHEIVYDSSPIVSLRPNKRLQERFKKLGDDEDATSLVPTWLELPCDKKKAMFFQYLDLLKERAQENRDAARKRPQPVYFSNIEGLWQIMPDGMGTGVKLRWRVERGGVKIGIHSNPKGAIPAVMVEFNYEAVKFQRFPDVVAAVEEVLRSWGFCIKAQKISRIDVQLTFPKPFSLIAKAFEEHRVVTRVRQWSKYTSAISRRIDTSEDETEYTGFASTPPKRSSKTKHASKTIEIRIYDKIKECFKGSDSLEKLNDLYAVLGIREHLTRVEFELHREFLKEYGIDTIVDFYAKLPELLRYLTHSYFRVVEDPKNSHSERQKTAAWWEDVARMFELAFNATFEGKTLKRIEKKVWNAERLIQQALGCIRAALEVFPGEKEMTYTEFIKIITRVLHKESLSLYHEYQKGRKQFIIQKEPLTDKPAQFDYSEIVAKRYDLYKD